MFDLDMEMAILHHILVFALVAVLFAEFVMVRPGSPPRVEKGLCKGL